MELEEQRIKRYSDLLSTLEKADNIFAGGLRDSARSLLLYRIAGSTEKSEEMSFLLSVIAKISEDRGNPQELSDSVRELSRVLGEDADSKSVGFLFSTMTDVLDYLTMTDLYRLLDSMRKEPIHTRKFSDEPYPEEKSNSYGQ